MLSGVQLLSTVSSIVINEIRLTASTASGLEVFESTKYVNISKCWVSCTAQACKHASSLLGSQSTLSWPLHYHFLASRKQQNSCFKMTRIQARSLSIYPPDDIGLQTRASHKIFVGWLVRNTDSVATVRYCRKSICEWAPCLTRISVDQMPTVLD